LELFFKEIKNCNTIEGSKKILYKIVKPSIMVKEAVEFAIKAHDGVMRKSGEPYSTHPILVAAITAYISENDEMIAAALLHDVVEDTSITTQELTDKFGKTVSHLVEGMTKISDIKEEEFIYTESNKKLITSAMSFRKMLLASIEDVNVLVIKLCDRVHNMLTLSSHNKDAQLRIAEETLVVYAPIAHKLGISKLKNHLEDLSFYYIFPKEYTKIDDYINAERQNLQLKLNNFIETTKDLMHQNGIDWESFEIFGRVKHYYSIHLKMQRKGVSIEEVLDLLAVRIILKDEITCYKVLGLLHINYSPLIARFKDYIAIPKDNGYQTIHSTVFNDNAIIEAQIRTNKMNDLAEFGVASHWKYKNTIKVDDTVHNNISLDWIKSMQYTKDSPEEFYELAKYDLFSEDISVYSPRGELYTLPRDSVALDFAYAIHSEIGDRASGTLVNKVKSSLLTILKNGDIVNISTDKEPRLRCSWIDTVKTSKAKDAIRTRCKSNLKECDRVTAYNILSTLFDNKTIDIKEIVSDLNIKNMMDRVPNELQVYQNIINRFANYLGHKKVRVWELFKKGYKVPMIKKIDHFNFYTNKSIDSVNFDYCCHPKLNDSIVAFYDSKKVVIHHKLCKEAYKQMKNYNRMLFVSWNSTKSYKYKLIISLQNQQGVLVDLLKKLLDLNLNILAIQLGITNSENAEYCRIEVESHEINIDTLKQKISQKFKLIEISSLKDAYNN